MDPFSLPITQLVDIAGRPIPGWIAVFTDGETFAALTCYKTADLSDQAAFGTQVVADGKGILPPLWLKPTGRTYRCTLLFPDGTSRTIDKLVLPPAPSSSTSTNMLLPPIARQGSAIAINPTDFGKVATIVTGTTPTPVLLPPIADVAPGALLALVSSAAGGMSVEPASGEGNAIPVLGEGAAVLIAAGSGGYTVVAQTNPTPTHHIVSTRKLTQPNSTAAAGTKFLVPSNPAVPFLEDYIYEANGDGTFSTFGPTLGLRATILDETDAANSPGGQSATLSLSVSNGQLNAVIGYPTPGAGYVAGQVVPVQGGNGGTLLISAVDNNGGITSAAPETVGSGYTAGNLVVGSVTAGSFSLPRELIYTAAGWANYFAFVIEAASSEALVILKGQGSTPNGSVAVFQDQYASGTTSLAAAGATPTSGVSFPIKMSTQIINQIAGLVDGAGQFTIPAGTFLIEAWRRISDSFTSAVLTFSDGGNNVLTGPPVAAPGAADDQRLTLVGEVTLTQATVFTLSVTIAGFNAGGSILGTDAAIANVPEVFGGIKITKVG